MFIFTLAADDEKNAVLDHRETSKRESIVRMIDLEQFETDKKRSHFTIYTLSGKVNICTSMVDYGTGFYLKCLC